MMKRNKLANWIYHNLSGAKDEFDICIAPGADCTLEFGAIENGEHMYVASTWGNDGFDLRIGYPSKWLFSCDAAEARQLAWFILWNVWAKDTWFGLKRKLWYWALHIRVLENSHSAEQMRGSDVASRSENSDTKGK